MDAFDHSDDTTCTVCREHINIFAVGGCDHPVCYKCATRMRALCCQNYCSICRTELSEVVFTKCLELYKNINKKVLLRSNAYGILLEDLDVKKKFGCLMEHVCVICKDKSKYKSFEDLSRHMRRTHELFYCDLCVLHLKSFTHERKCYNRKDLATHRRVGDPDDSSYKGHPLCQFCAERYLDKDELARHLLKDHFYCHFCDNNLFYNDYSELRDHFKTNHYMCDEGECINARFTHAFCTELDLRAHRASVHLKKNSHIRQELMLDVQLQLPPRFTDSRGRGGRGRPSGRVPRCIDRQETESAEVPERPPGAHDESHYPSLNGTQSQPQPAHSSDNTLARRLAMASHRSVGSLTFVTSDGDSVTQQPTVSTSHRFTVIDDDVIKEKPQWSTQQPSTRKKSDDFPSLPTNPDIRNKSISSTWQTKPQKKNSSKSNNADGNVSNICAYSPSAPIQSFNKKEFPSLEKRSIDRPKMIASGKSKQPKVLHEKKSKGVSEGKPKPKEQSTSNYSNVPFSDLGSNVSTVNSNPKKPTNGTKFKSKDKNKQNKYDSGCEKTSMLDHVERDDDRFVLKSTKNGIVDDAHSRKIDVIEGLVKLSVENTREEIDRNVVPVKNHISGYNNGKYTNGTLLVKDEPEVIDSAELSAPGEGAHVQDVTVSIADTIMSKLLSGYKPPPGFQMANSTVKPPPGFMSPTAESNVPMSPSNYSPMSSHLYRMPPDFDERNRKLIANIKLILNKSKKFDEFKRLSGMFRLGDMSGGEYYSMCSDLFPQHKFNNICPELVAMLPDISKQQDLLTVYSAAQGYYEEPGWKPHLLMFTTCGYCRQVLLKADYPHHISQHNDYSALS